MNYSELKLRKPLSRSRLATMIALAFVFFSQTSFAAKSSRAIPELAKDSTTSNVVPTADSALAKDSGSGIAGAAYMPNTERYAPGTAPTPVPAPPPPQVNMQAFQQAISMFMQFMQGPGKKADPEYDLYPESEAVDYDEVARGSTAPPLPLFSTEALDSGCPGLPTEALQKMKRFVNNCNATLMGENVAITDFSTNTPVMYILRRSDLKCMGSTRVGFGKGSHGPPPVPKNTPSSNGTPGGFFVTKVHQGRLYQEWNSVGLLGLGPENDKTIVRGVIMHPSDRNTAGCIGIPSARFGTTKSALWYGAAVLNYFPGQPTPSENFCPSASNLNQPAVPQLANSTNAPIPNVGTQ